MDFETVSCRSRELREKRTCIYDTLSFEHASLRRQWVTGFYSRLYLTLMNSDQLKAAGILALIINDISPDTADTAI